MRKVLFVLLLLSGMSILARDCIDDDNEKKLGNQINALCCKNTNLNSKISL